MKPNRLSFILLFVLTAFRSVPNNRHFSDPALAKSEKIRLSAEMIINEGAKGNAGFLVDEQGRTAKFQPGTTR